MTDRTAEDRAIDATAPPDVDLELLDYDDGLAEETLTDWSLEDLEGAAWAGRKLRRVRGRIARFRAIAEDQKARIDEWLASEVAGLEADERFFLGRLQGFHRRQYDQDPKHATTIRLPDGTVLRSVKGKLAVVVNDVEAFARWCEAHELAEEMLRYPEPEPQKQLIATTFGAKAAEQDDPGEWPAIVKETGETVPGITIERRERSFTANTDEEVPE